MAIYHYDSLYLDVRANKSNESTSRPELKYRIQSAVSNTFILSLSCSSMEFA